MLTSMVCRYEHFLTDWYTRHVASMKLPPRQHRKVWEWCAIVQALEERGMLEAGRSGCGFAVGTEPLPSAFAARGIDILATDQPGSAEAQAWSSVGQHAASLDVLFRPELIGREVFNSHVRFRSADMRNLGLPWDQQFDFVWSSCSIEHLGSLKAGMDFVEQATQLLAPGGCAVHTTEFNVASNETTLGTGTSVIYRQRDIENLDRRLRRVGCGLTRCDFYAGDHPHDLDYDVPPYDRPERPHIKLLLGGHVTTSMLLIVRRG